MQLGALGRTTPILLVLGGIAAPLAFAQFFVWTDTAGDAIGSRPAVAAAVPDAAPDVSRGFLPAALTGDCAGAGIVALGSSMTLDDSPYAIAEGEAPLTSPHSVELVHRPPLVLGSRLRVQSPSVTADAGCDTDPAYGPDNPADDPIKT